MAKPKLWLGLTAVGLMLCGTFVAGEQLCESYKGLINDVLGLSTTKVGKVEGSAYAENGQLTDAGWERMIKDSYKYCEESLEQGAVLLKNDNGALPLAEDERNVTLLGQGSRNLFMRSGAGGASPNTNLVVSLDKAFKNNGFKINNTVFKAYSKLSNSQMTNPGTQVEHAFSNFYTNEMKDSFSQYGDAAIITLVRIGTENTDPSAGQLDLKDDEKKLLQLAKEYKENGTFKKVIVMINSPMPMSMDWIDNKDYGIDAALWMGVPGYYGVGGVVHVLMGKDAEGKAINPSGHCPDTFAASASSSPAYVNFGQSAMAVYQEGVYVGYKYYESRYFDAVLGQGNATGTAGTFINKAGWNYADEMGYPFGYGLSYTTFDQKIDSVAYDAATDTYNVKVEVKNTGDVAGKASVQVYVHAPYTEFDKTNKLGKPAIALMAYDKVDLAKGETKKITVPVEKYFLTTYDNKVNKTYILEGGDYYFSVGNGAHEAINNVLAETHPEATLTDHLGNKVTGNKAAVAKVAIDEDLTTYKKSHYNDTTVENQFDDADYNYFANKNSKTPITYLSREDWQGTWPTKQSNNPATSADGNMQQYYQKSATAASFTEGDGVEYNVPVKDEEGNVVKIKFSDMANVPLGDEYVEEGKFAGEKGEDVWDKFIKQMNLDDLAISVSDNRGILAVGKVNKSGNSVAEGPEGLLSRFQYGKDKRWATGFPTGPVYTATFDHAMQKKFGGFYGEEALFAGVACVNAPGANINRTPYGSRASEYMSEDGIMNYHVAANVIGEARKKGLIMNIKHCFLNNQETGRQRIYTYCNEQAIREIYLKPFEGALTKGRGLGIMTSYNRIGARYAACHEPLMKNVMRGEWGYKGLIIDDALTGSNNDQYSNGPAMLHCGTDLFCLDGNRGGQLKDFIRSNNDGDLLKDLQRANKYVMYAISRSFMGGIEVSDAEIYAQQHPWWKNVVDGAFIGVGVLTAAAAGLYVFTEFFKKDKKEAAEAAE
ncbi:MAG: glycoside hydrolase family 3 C-terminal domain-containing protein [Bacilli bacterium]|nr:glycoside hydrolase family 3 C-terminal domain-containing protein [Bacilli bacterium]